MSVSVFQIKRWLKMVSGRSPEHVNQTLGQCFSKDKIEGYYNNLTPKVLIEPHWLKSEEMVTLKRPDGSRIVFPVAMFQYALGCYDLYLQTDGTIYRDKFMQYAEWTLEHQDTAGRWDNFKQIYPQHPYGAMAQGEAVSVLVRAFVQTKEWKYMEAAKTGIDFMLKPLSDGGTSLYEGDDLFFMEYTHLPVVLNGWIFSWWGLYDYVLLTHDEGAYRQKLEKSLDTLVKSLPRFEYAFWSRYDFGTKLASPFYHRLHIAQMQAMYALTGKDVFKKYADKWIGQLDNPVKKGLAFCVKAMQKIRE